MVIITGRSATRDGLMFLVKHTKDIETAYRYLEEVYLGYYLHDNGRKYLIDKEYRGYIPRYHELPGDEGWVLKAGVVDDLGFCNDAVCW